MDKQYLTIENKFGEGGFAASNLPVHGETQIDMMALYKVMLPPYEQHNGMRQLYDPGN